MCLSVPETVASSMNPGEVMRDMILSHARHHDHNYMVLEREAITYGIVVGWPEKTLTYLATLHKWNDENVAWLKALNATFESAFFGVPSQVDQKFGVTRASLQRLYDELRMAPGSII